jgi:hypothetical protein
LLPDHQYRHNVSTSTLILVHTDCSSSSKLAGRPTPKSFFQAMSQQSPYPSDSHYSSSGYPPPQRTIYPSEEYKASYDDLVDEYATPFGRNAQHQTFAVESPILGSPPQHRRGPSLPPLEQKQSYLSDGKYTEEDLRSQAPRILPVKGEREVDTRTVWQKVSLRRFRISAHSLTADTLLKDLTRIAGMPILCHNCPCSNRYRPGD